jgi:carbon-monoxide dehydrogenase small subunit
MLLAVEADGSSVETIEGEAEDGKLSDIQQAFQDHHAVQCGFCTAGMVMSVRELIQRNPKPSLEEIQNGIEGNFCRCTGYQQIIEAVQDVTGQLEKKGELKHV